MKITGDTKIKELIPEGFELWGDDFKVKSFPNPVTCEIRFDVRKKEVKDFNWYVSQYFNDSKRFPYTMPERLYQIILSNLSCHSYESVPFEIRIGLLKFICDDLNRDKKDKYSYVYVLNMRDTISMSDFMKNIDTICPKEFINSLFE